VAGAAAVMAGAGAGAAVAATAETDTNFASQQFSKSPRPRAGVFACPPLCPPGRRLLGSQASDRYAPFTFSNTFPIGPSLSLANA
jgi:hypothetical protein